MSAQRSNPGGRWGPFASYTSFLSYPWDCQYAAYLVPRDNRRRKFYWLNIAVVPPHVGCPTHLTHLTLITLYHIWGMCRCYYTRCYSFPPSSRPFCSFPDFVPSWSPTSQSFSTTSSLATHALFTINKPVAPGTFSSRKKTYGCRYCCAATARQERVCCGASVCTLSAGTTQTKSKFRSIKHNSIIVSLATFLSISAVYIQ